MSVGNYSPEYTSTRAAARKDTSFPQDTGGLDDTPASMLDRDHLLDHLGRRALHACKDRNFEKAFTRLVNGELRPRMYRTSGGYEELQRCQYVKLTHPQRVAVIVIDIDLPGESGGRPQDLHPKVREGFQLLIDRMMGPSWVGINPLTGKAQAIWLIDPMCADLSRGPSRHMRLVKACGELLSMLLYGDRHFSHGFSRNPCYTGKNEGTYRWYIQHKRVYRVGDLMPQLRDLTGTPEPTKKPQRFESGRDLINAVQARRKQAEAFKALAADASIPEVEERLDAVDPSLVEGVRVLWIVRDERAARDETAFRHALKTAYRLRAAGQQMTDARIIDAYEHAYNVAQRVGADDRAPEMPKMRDRQSMARRVRGYVLGGKVDATGSLVTAPGVVDRERKALSTMGRRGGQKAAQRWKDDPHGEYAQGRRQALKQANEQRKAVGEALSARIRLEFADAQSQGVEPPTTKQLAEKYGVSMRRVQQIKKNLGYAGRTGRPNKAKRHKQ